MLINRLQSWCCILSQKNPSLLWKNQPVQNPNRSWHLVLNIRWTMYGICGTTRMCLPTLSETCSTLPQWIRLKTFGGESLCQLIVFHSFSVPVFTITLNSEAGCHPTVLITFSRRVSVPCGRMRLTRMVVDGWLALRLLKNILKKFGWK